MKAFDVFACEPALGPQAGASWSLPDELRERAIASPNAPLEPLHHALEPFPEIIERTKAPG
ncbi:MAG TPA: hypothetical protein VGF24_10370 [Vicinamibacterales bacterium]